MIKWAENEIKRLIEKSKCDGDTAIERGEYEEACCESALKAFKSLTEDNHSGMSIKYTQRILNNLIDGKPLTPIEDEDDIWEFAHMQKDTKVYQCNRMSSLFKYVSSNGSVAYTDTKRVVCVSYDSPDVPYYDDFITKIINEMFPIEMPYYPEDLPYKVYVLDILDDSDLNIMQVHRIKCPNGDFKIVNRFFKEDAGKWVEIDLDEWIKRYGRIF